MKLSSIAIAGLATLGAAQKAFAVSSGPAEDELMPYSWDDAYDFMSADFQDQFHIQYADGSIRGKRIDKYLPEDELLRKRLVSDEDSARVQGGQLFLDIMIGWSKGHGIGGDNKRYKMPVNLWNNATLLYDYEDIPSCSESKREPCDPVTDPGCVFADAVRCNYKDNIFAYNTTNGTNVNDVLLGTDTGYNISLIHQSIIGNLYTDFIQIGDPASGPAFTVDGFAFVAAQKGTTQFPGMGFAPGKYLEGTMNVTNVTTDFAASLMYSGYTESRSLALYMVNGSTTSPHMLFGGLDTSLAKDNFFVSYPLLKGNNFSYPTQYMVTLTGVSVTADDGTSVSLGTLMGSCGDDLKGDCVPVGFDTSTYMSYLPRNVVINLAIQLNAMYSSDMQLWIQSCAYRTIGGYLNIELTSNVFSVPISQMLMPMVDSQGNAMKFNGGDDACYLAIRPSENRGYNSLGLGFMQNFYMVFDPDDNYVSLGTLKSLHELDTEAFKNRYPNPVKPLKPGRLSKIANVTTVSEQAQITFQYVTPTVVTEIITTTSDGIAIQQGPLGAPVPTSANSLLVLTYGSSVMSLQGIPIGGTSALESGTVSGNARIDPTGGSTRTTSSTQRPPQIQIFGTPVSGSLTIFKQGSPTEVPPMARQAPVGNSQIGAPRSGASRLLQGLGVTLGMGLVGTCIIILA
ncbi:Aspartic proteinase yapsin-7 [Yarrowia sp. B02]|nr:Aspartic proteinase yapsin-7 [Yarrowia sp. B02]